MRKKEQTSMRKAGIMIAAMIVTAALYPALHECGHLLAAWAADVEITGAGLIDQPFVSFRSDRVSYSRVLFIAAGGGFLPLCLLLLPGRGAARGGVKLSAALTGLFCGVESAVMGVLYLAGGPADAMDDSVILLRQYPEESAAVFLVLSVQIAVAAGYLLDVRPLKRLFRDTAHMGKTAEKTT